MHSDMGVIIPDLKLSMLSAYEGEYYDEMTLTLTVPHSDDQKEPGLPLSGDQA